MYQVQATRSVVAVHRGLARRRIRVPRTVLLLGVTSLLTDISAEMVATVLPLYLVAVVGISPLAFGAIDGIYNGGSAIARLAAGFAGDRLGRHKAVAVAGYGLSLISRPLLLVAGSAPALAATIGLDRIGKGIRTAPRDAMISLSSRPQALGLSFGVHRALDTTGALLGPLVAFAILALAPGDFEAVFMVSFLVGLAGLGVLVLLVEAPRVERPPEAEEQRLAPRELTALLAEPRMRSITLAAALLGVTTISDGFLYLTLQRRLDLDLSFFPLLFVATALVYMSLAIPAGRLADRIGRGHVLLGGYALLLPVYALLAVSEPGPWLVLCTVGLLGASYACTDGVLSALASDVSPARMRASALALVGTASSLARLVASLAFGAVWVAASATAAIVLFGAGLLVALACSRSLLARSAPRA